MNIHKNTHPHTTHTNTHTTFPDVKKTLNHFRPGSENEKGSSYSEAAAGANSQPRSAWGVVQQGGNKPSHLTIIELS